MTEWGNVVVFVLAIARGLRKAAGVISRMSLSGIRVPVNISAYVRSLSCPLKIGKEESNCFDCSQSTIR